MLNACQFPSSGDLGRVITRQMPTGDKTMTKTKCDKAGRDFGLPTALSPLVLSCPVHPHLPNVQSHICCYREGVQAPWLGVPACRPPTPARLSGLVPCFCLTAGAALTPTLLGRPAYAPSSSHLRCLSYTVPSAWSCLLPPSPRHPPTWLTPPHLSLSSKVTCPQRPLLTP